MTFQTLVYKELRISCEVSHRDENELGRSYKLRDFLFALTWVELVSLQPSSALGVTACAKKEIDRAVG